MERIYANHNQNVLYGENHFQEKENIHPPPPRNPALQKPSGLEFPFEITQETCCASQLIAPRV